MGSSSKGSGAGAGSKTYYYGGTIAFLSRCGRTDGLTSFELDGKIIWSGPVRRVDSPNPVVITIEGHGEWHHYWGLDDQLTPHPALTAAGNDLGDDHPAYTGQSYDVLVGFIFGQERNLANRIKVRAWAVPDQDVISGSAAALDDDLQANPIAVIAELTMHPRYGQATQLSEIEQTTWQASANTVRDSADLFYVSPLLTAPLKLKDVADELFSICDGYFRTNLANGCCEVGVYPLPETIDPATLPLIDSRSLSEDSVPNLKPQTLDDVKGRWIAVYTDRDKNFKERPVPYNDPHDRTKRTPETLQRKHICRRKQARSHVQKYGRKMALRGGGGTIEVRREVATSFRPGTHIRLDIDAEPGGVQLQQVCRLLSIERPRTGPVTLTVEYEPSLQPIVFNPGPDPTEPATPPEVPQIVDFRFFELPPGLSPDGSNFDVGVLASRPAGLVTDFKIYYDMLAGGNFPQVGAARSYGLRGRLNGAVGSGDAGPFSIELLDALNRDLLAEDPGDVLARDDTLLMIVLKIAGTGQIQADGDDKPWIEIFSVESIVAAGTNIRTITAMRSRRGTPARAFANHDEVWFIRRVDLPFVDHADFRTLGPAAGTAYFKLQPAEADRERPLADCSLLSFSFALNRDAALQGKYRKRIYKTAASLPATPTGDTPAGWSETPPAPVLGAFRWVSEAYFNTLDHILGAWTTPVPIDGTPGPGLFFKEDYDSSAFYFQTASRRDVVFYPTDGHFYLTNNLSKSGTNTWGTPGGADWEDGGTDWQFIATKLLLTYDAFIKKTLTLGTIGPDAGRIQTDNYVAGLSGVLISEALTELNDVLIRGMLSASKIQTDAVAFNGARPANEMAIRRVGFADYTTAHNLNGTEYIWLYTANGWNVGGAGFDPDRFGKPTMQFVVSVGAGFNLTSSFFDLQGVYRINGGSAVNCTHAVRALFGNGWASVTGSTEITGLTEDDVIEFGVRLVTPNSQPFADTEATVEFSNL